MKLGILGASGRMGKAVVANASRFHATVTAAVVSEQSSRYGEPIYPNAAEAGVRFQHAGEIVLHQTDVLIDFFVTAGVRK